VLEIFLGVNVLGALLLFLFSGAFLAGGFGNGLVLCARNTGAESSKAQKENGRRDETERTRDSPQAWSSRLERHGAV
jgi:hypothetical protein